MIPVTDNDIKQAIGSKLTRYYGVDPAEAEAVQMYHAVILTVKDILSEKRTAFKEQIKKSREKRICYLCMEFLTGPLLRQNLSNLGLYDMYKKALDDLGFDLSQLCESEPDPGLGNGGLGRLAACFMDSLSTLGYHATGFSICYEYGLFRQRILDGDQIELPDMWMDEGGDWLTVRADRIFKVRFGGNIREVWENGELHVIHEHYDEVQALPCDMLISGYDSDGVGVLRLWRARDPINFDMNLFSQGKYVRAVEESTANEMISKVLYPSDNHDEGKLLRLMQQYFLVSATCQNIIRDHIDMSGSLDTFAEKNAVHLNDTHPALVIPELMRIFMDDFRLSWDRSWEIVTSCVTYTNHTVMPEALESWRCELVRLKLPRIYMILEEINRRLCEDLWQSYPGDFERISRMSVSASAHLRMANLSVAAAKRVNGVSALHSRILKRDLFRDYYKWKPQKFDSVTNGIAHRRWLCTANPKLASLIEECIGDSYRKDPEKLSEFSAFAGDDAVRQRLFEIRRENKEKMCCEIFNRTGRSADPDSIFDVQVKRIHEYKRQLLNTLKIISLYNDVVNGVDITPCTFIFGGKAAPGYYMAKSIIKLIWSLGEEIAADPRACDLIRVVYLEEYNVSLAEKLIPSADISEQISLAGKEASGTGCMKFMINGALTIGTYDGANVEMEEAVGKDSIFIFGQTASEVDERWRLGYDSSEYLRKSPRASAALERLRHGFAGHTFENIERYLTGGFGVSDPYMCLADFDPYISAFGRMTQLYGCKDKWYEKSVKNIAAAGYFAADRSIKEYAKRIWETAPVKSGKDS
ncbi:MAG: glycogen/starch/alpha-glucan phosphorylase [Ruminococcaceae bacterium]|nr:glycogen/starch/alpha-glucan phosphorylase [Oscillospiraceae bacterium]